jgi:hypothetical protein
MGGSVAISVNPAERERADAISVWLISLLTLSVFLTLFVFRAADDNRLTSWQWVFTDGDVVRFSAILIAGVALAYLLSMTSLPERHPLPVLFCLSFFAGALFWTEPEVIVDAARYFTQAKQFAVYGPGYFLREWGGEIQAWTDLPLVPFLYGVIFSLWGEARAAVQAFTTLLFSGTVALTYLIGRTLWDDTVGFYGGALLLAMPYLLTQVPLMLVDVPTMFFLTLTVFTVIKGIERGGAGWIALSSVGATAALLSKYSTWPLLTVVPIIVLVYVRKTPGPVLRRAAVLVLSSLFLAGAAAFMTYDVVAEQIRLLRGYQVPGLARWRESFASTFLFQIHPFVAAGAAYSVVVAFRRKDVKYAVVGWLLLLVVMFRVERARYLLVVFPMLALMAAYGMREIRNSRIRRFAALCAVISSLAVAVFGYLPFLTGTSAVNLKEAGAYLDSVEAGTVEVFALSQAGSAVNPAVSVPLLDLFTDRKIVYRHRPAPPSGGTAIETSPLRFTWEYRNPDYYRPEATDPLEHATVAIISGGGDQPLPDEIARRLSGHRLSRTFRTSGDRFQYKTFVRVYEPVARTPS